MKILEGSELKKAQDFLKKATEISRKSLCSVSKIGVLVVKEGKVIGQACNGPLDKVCSPCLQSLLDKNVKTELCFAVHAEKRAILDAMEKGYDTNGADLYSARVVKGKIVPYKNGLCAACSRVFLESGIDRVILSKKEGVVSYKAEEFYDLSFDRFIQKKFIM